MKRFPFLCGLFTSALAAFVGCSIVGVTSAVNPGKVTPQSPNDLLPPAGVVIMTPVEQYAWRVWPGGKIEYSFDGLRTWETQKSGVTADLTGGSAPTAKICWVIGKAGTILLTTDQGRHWKKIVAPIQDIAGIEALDSKHAGIWSASHKQSFATNDGGVTWAPNVGG